MRGLIPTSLGVRCAVRLRSGQCLIDLNICGHVFGLRRQRHGNGGGWSGRRPVLKSAPAGGRLGGFRAETVEPSPPRSLRWSDRRLAASLKRRKQGLPPGQKGGFPTSPGIGIDQRQVQSVFFETAAKCVRFVGVSCCDSIGVVWLAQYAGWLEGHGSLRDSLAPDYFLVVQRQLLLRHAALHGVEIRPGPAFRPAAPDDPGVDHASSLPIQLADLHVTHQRLAAVL